MAAANAQIGVAEAAYQTTALNHETTAVQIRGRRMTAAVLLIQALGGG